MSLRELIRGLLIPREYKEIDGVLCVRERWGDWTSLDEHMRREHPEEYEELKKLE